jgi:hypothetical protein
VPEDDVDGVVAVVLVDGVVAVVVEADAEADVPPAGGAVSAVEIFGT